MKIENVKTVVQFMKVTDIKAERDIVELLILGFKVKKAGLGLVE